jgi:integral membrane protein (TIGR01906 family)
VRRILGLTAIICAVALPLAVITSVVLDLVWDAGFYHDGQVHYEVQRATGLTQDQMDLVNRAIVRFFGSAESLPDALRATGAPPDVFQQKEVLHMNDVRAVIQAFGTVQIASLTCVALFLVLTIAAWQRGGRWAMSRALIYSAIVTVALGLLFGAATLVDFDTLFLTFHEITFHNDFWQLDPRTDHLIQMFPFGFWYDAMLIVALRVVLVTLVAGGVGVVLGNLGKSQRRRV